MYTVHPAGHPEVYTRATVPAGRSSCKSGAEANFSGSTSY